MIHGVDTCCALGREISAVLGLLLPHRSCVHHCKLASTHAPSSDPVAQARIAVEATQPACRLVLRLRASTIPLPFEQFLRTQRVSPVKQHPTASSRKKPLLAPLETELRLAVHREYVRQLTHHLL